MCFKIQISPKMLQAAVLLIFLFLWFYLDVIFSENLIQYIILFIQKQLCSVLDFLSRCHINLHRLKLKIWVLRGSFDGFLVHITPILSKSVCKWVNLVISIRFRIRRTLNLSIDLGILIGIYIYNYHIANFVFFLRL